MGIWTNDHHWTFLFTSDVCEIIMRQRCSSCFLHLFCQFSGLIAALVITWCVSVSAAVHALESGEMMKDKIIFIVHYVPHPSFSPSLAPLYMRALCKSTVSVDHVLALTSAPLTIRYLASAVLQQFHKSQRANRGMRGGGAESCWREEDRKLNQSKLRLTHVSLGPSHLM